MNRYDVRYMQLQQEKLDAIISKEAKVTHVEKELGITRKTIHQWLIRYKQYGIDGLLPQRRRKGEVAHNRTPEHLEKTITIRANNNLQNPQKNKVKYDPYHITTKKEVKKEGNASLFV